MASEPEKSQISHLIRLIDDRDEFVRNRVRDQLIQLGEDAIPFLEIAVRAEKPEVKSLAQEVIRAIFPKQLLGQFRKLATTLTGGQWDLETGVVLLSKFGYPDEETDIICRTLDQLAAEAFDLIRDEKSPEQAVQILTRFLFYEKGFEGNRTDFLSPDNTYFSRMLENRKGIPITLSTLCVFVGQRLGLPIVGVGLPGHYIAKYDSLTQPVYFDPFDKGRILSPEDCSSLAEKMGYHFEEHYLGTATNTETLVRMMNNLVMTYNKSSQLEKAGHLAEFIKALSGDPRSNSPIRPH